MDSHSSPNCFRLAVITSRILLVLAATALFMVAFVSIAAADTYRFERAWGYSASPSTPFQSLDGVEVDRANGNNVFATDHGTDDVSVFGQNGNVIQRFGGTGSSDGKFESPDASPSSRTTDPPTPTSRQSA